MSEELILTEFEKFEVEVSRIMNKKYPQFAAMVIYKENEDGPMSLALNKEAEGDPGFSDIERTFDRL